MDCKPHPCPTSRRYLFPGAEPDFDGHTTGAAARCLACRACHVSGWSVGRTASRRPSPTFLPCRHARSPPRHAGEDVVTASGKFEVLDRLLGLLLRRGHRVVLFSQFNMTLDILEDYLNMRGHK